MSLSFMSERAAGIPAFTFWRVAGSGALNISAGSVTPPAMATATFDIGLILAVPGVLVKEWSVLLVPFAVPTACRINGPSMPVTSMLNVP
jgi:uncharacterized membrane protein